MPITDKNKPGASKSEDSGTAQVTQDEDLADTVSAYLDGELSRADLEEFEILLRNDEALSRDVAEMRRIGGQLTELGADILAEPIPDALLQALDQLERK